jgi:8-oxo-dGTP pyrophosphatase MutT (NUDIX family)
MKKERNKAVPAVYLIFMKDNKVLLGRRKNTTYYDDWYGVPAGHVEAGELPTSAGIREAKEEVGLIISPEDMSSAHILYRTAHDATGDRADYFFIVKNGLASQRLWNWKNVMTCNGFLYKVYQKSLSTMKSGFLIISLREFITLK